MKNLLAILLITTGLLSSSLYAREYAHGDLFIDSPYTRTTPPGAPVAGGFLRITNNGKETDILIGGKTDFSGAVEVHEMPMIDGVMKMRQLEGGLEIPPGETVELKPGSFHIMFIDLKEQMIKGEKHKGTLTFKKAGDVEVEFVVKDIGQPMRHGMKHDMKNEPQLSEMPDLMKVVVMHGDKLKLSGKQQAELKKWRKNNKEHVRGMAKSIKKANKELMDLALGDADKAALETQYAKIAGLRKSLVDAKIACRDNLKQVLDADQYQTLQALYKEHFISAKK